MYLLNIKLIILGALFGFLIFCCNILYVILCFLFRIKVIDFSMFLSPKFALHKEKNGQTNFILGWLPITSFVKPFGKTSEIDEQNSISQEESSFAFFTKEKYKKVLILFVPSIVYCLFGIISSYLILKSLNESVNIDFIFSYLKEAFITIFGDDEQIRKFGLLTEKYILENNILIFTYFLFSCILLFCSLIDNFINYLNLNVTKSTIEKIGIILLLIIFAIFIVWKIPFLIFKYYTMSEVLIFLMNFLVGAFLIGIVLYFVFISSLKLFKIKLLLSLICLFLLFACEKKQDVLLPKSNLTIVKNVQDHSPIYIFFKVDGKDTIADVNRKNSIISTNWIFNIDKRLPLKTVIPEVIKLQEKKRGDSAHKNENAENYYSYADSVGKNLAFVLLTKVFYKMDRPEKGNFVVYFTKGKKQQVFMGNQEIKIAEILKQFYSIKFQKVPNLVFVFDKNMSYEEYIQYKILLQKDVTYNLDRLPVEFIL